MQDTILYVGLDVDDTRYHGSALNKHTGEVRDFHCSPTLKGLMIQLNKLAQSFPGCSIRTCYDASYCGYEEERGAWSLLCQLKGGAFPFRCHFDFLSFRPLRRTQGRLREKSYQAAHAQG